ncbi:MAG: HU family DNA-binding protein [Hasllibacter sp.]
MSMTTRKTPTRKTTAKAAPARPAPKVVSDAPVNVTGQLTKKELIDRVVARSGMRKKFAKPAVEAALAVMGEALSKGEGLNLQPMGKLHVRRRKELANGEVLTARLRRKGAKGAAAAPDAAPAAEASDAPAGAAPDAAA